MRNNEKVCSRPNRSWTCFLLCILSHTISFLVDLFVRQSVKYFDNFGVIYDGDVMYLSSLHLALHSYSGGCQGFAVLRFQAIFCAVFRFQRKFYAVFRFSRNFSAVFRFLNYLRFAVFGQFLCGFSVYGEKICGFSVFKYLLCGYRQVFVCFGLVKPNQFFTFHRFSLHSSVKCHLYLSFFYFLKGKNKTGDK